MTLEDFIKNVLGAKAQNMSQEKIELYYRKSVGFFNVYFDKWKKETYSSSDLK
jgi:hypothetical protein